VSSQQDPSKAEEELAMIAAMPLFPVIWRHPACDLHFTKERVFATPKGKMAERYSRRISGYNFKYADIESLQIGSLGEPYSITVTFKTGERGKAWSSIKFLTTNQNADSLRTLLPTVVPLNGKLKIKP
jgi:hypothetical protein